MANSNGSFGLRPLNKMGGGANSTATSNYTFYEIANGNTNKLYHGEPVIPLSTGYIDAPGAAAGGTVGLLGVFQGCEYVSSTSGKPIWSNYWPGSGADSNHPVEARLLLRLLCRCGLWVGLKTQKTRISARLVLAQLFG